jgi:hypothetical protein
MNRLKEIITAYPLFQDMKPEHLDILARGATAAEFNRDFACELVTRVARVVLQRLQATRRRLAEFYEPID